MREGDTVSLEVTVTNRRDAGCPMSMAIVGLPAGLEAPTKVLDDLKKAEAVDFWELRGRDLVLYWRDLAPRESKQVQIDLLARVPGTHHRTGLPGLPLLHPRQQALGRTARDHRAARGAVGRILPTQVTQLVFEPRTPSAEILSADPTRSPRWASRSGTRLRARSSVDPRLACRGRLRPCELVG